MVCPSPPMPHFIRLGQQMTDIWGYKGRHVSYYTVTCIEEEGVVCSFLIGAMNLLIYATILLIGRGLMSVKTFGLSKYKSVLEILLAKSCPSMRG